MSSNNYEYLTKSNVESPIAFKKSPGKLGYYQSKANQSPYLERSTVTTTNKDWLTPDYQNVKKVSSGYSNLRQTIDSSSNFRFQEQLARYDFDNDVNQKGSKKLDSLLRETFNGRVHSPLVKDLTRSTYDRAYKMDGNSDVLYRHQKNAKSPSIPVKKADIQEKLKQYSNAVQRFKDQLETNNKMSEELKRLKQDRQRRLEAKQKQQTGSTFSRDAESFKKKRAEEFHTPKYQKSAYDDRLGKQKNSGSSINLEKYKHNQIQEIRAKYDSNIRELKKPPVPQEKSKQIKKLLEKSGINDFVLGRNLGEGKFGVVYQAFHKSTGWIFALKKVPKEMIKSHLMIDQFILELKLQNFLNHQNILGIYNQFEDKTSVYLVLEYMEEGTLFTHLKKNKTLPEAQVANKIKQIASAIKYLHENQIAHRDIKPENIVMSHGICKLCDFGWATVCNDRRKTYCGTFDYAPPEILEGVEYDYTVDLWCLGVLTYQLLVGKAPFYHISRKQTMKRIMNVEKTNIEYPEHLSRQAISFIDHLIKKDPQKRMSSEIILQHPFLKNV